MSAAGAFSSSGSSDDVEKPCEAIQRWRRTRAMASTKVGTGLAYQATVRWVIGQRSCNAWAARATQENKPFPQMDVDPARQQIDDVVAQILGLDPE